MGLFSLPLGKRVAKVTAVESGSAAIRDLQFNAERAGVAMDARQSSVDAFLESLTGAPDFVLADPPRSGLGKTVVAHLARLGPPRLTIVACDPATLARDLAGLVNAGYRIDGVTMIDVFPQTFHIEAIVRLSGEARSCATPRDCRRRDTGTGETSIHYRPGGGIVLRAL